MTKKKKPVVRHHQKEMYPLIEKWLSSGEKRQSFCQKMGFSVHVFDYWLGRYRRDQRASAGEFVAVRVPSSEPKTGVPFASLRFPDGRELRLESAVEADFLRKLLGC